MPDVRTARLACALALIASPALAAPALAAPPAPPPHFLTLPKHGQAHAGAASASQGVVRAAPKPVVNGAPPVGAIKPAGLHLAASHPAPHYTTHKPGQSRPYVSSKRTISSSPR